MYQHLLCATVAVFALFAKATAQETRQLNSFRFVDIVPGYRAHETGPDVRLQRSLGLLPATYYPEQGEVYVVTFNPDTVAEQAVSIRMLNSTYRVDSSGPERREVYAPLTQKPKITPAIARYLLECSEAIPLLHYSYNERTAEYFLTAEVPPDLDTTTMQQLLTVVGSEAFIRSIALGFDSLERGVHPQIMAMFSSANGEAVDGRLTSALASTGLAYTTMPRGVFEVGFVDNLRPDPIMLYAESATLLLGSLEFRNLYALITAWPNTDEANATCIPLLTFNEEPLKFGNLSIAAAGDGSVSALYLNAYVPAISSGAELNTYLQRLAGQAASIRNYLAH
jgi:hypothetical protein